MREGESFFCDEDCCAVCVFHTRSSSQKLRNGSWTGELFRGGSSLPTAATPTRDFRSRVDASTPSLWDKPDQETGLLVSMSVFKFLVIRSAPTGRSVLIINRKNLQRVRLPNFSNHRTSAPSLSWKRVSKSRFSWL